MPPRRRPRKPGREKTEKRLPKFKPVSVEDIQKASDEKLRNLNIALWRTMEKVLSSRLPEWTEGAIIRVFAEEKRQIITEIIRRAIERQFAGRLDENVFFDDNFRENKKTGKSALALAAVETTPRKYIPMLAKAIHEIEMKQIYGS